jgi:glycogen(starch) synthase
MRILVHGRFYPSVGGIETVVNLLAREWVAAGHEPLIVSNLPAVPQRSCGFPFRVLYRPGLVEWFGLVKWAQVVLHMNLSLKAAWPHCWLCRPLIISHQSCYRSQRSCSSYFPSRREYLKLRCMSCASNIAASQAISRALSVSSRIIPNPYDNGLFMTLQTVPRDRELVFVGRLVCEKGVDLLLEAMKYLQPPWHTARLTVVGDGPERASLQTQAKALGLSLQVTFRGVLDQERVAQELRRHKILVVPSLYEEPFGIVALEGAASGCLVIGSDGGGLHEAIGPAGTTFRRGNAVDLAAQLMRLLAADTELVEQPALSEHLKRHHPGQIASEYLKVFMQPSEVQTPRSPDQWNTKIRHAPIAD